MSIFTRFLLEVSIKNLLVVVLFMGVFVPLMRQDLSVMKMADKGTVLSMLGFLMAGAIVAAFELSYARTDITSSVQRWLAHATKFVLFVGIGCLLYIAMWSIDLGGPTYLWSVGFPSMCVYLALFLHDFWDANSVRQRLE